ncbi:MAG: cytochrome c, partial [Chitinophagaceae bacterium]|nr:cytochrome c [Chitinophagaceae bacterium]
MSRFRKIMPRIIAISFLVFCVTFSFRSTAQDGEQLFKTNCANCHKPDADFVGPKLQGVKDAIPYPEWIYDWVHNPSAMIVKDAYAKKLADKWKPIVMTSFSSLTNAEIDAIMKYVDDYKPPTAKAAPGGGVAAEPVVDNSMIFGILTLILAIVAF